MPSAARVLLVVLISLVAAAPARAGDYVTWSCKNGANQPASTAGWASTDGLGFGGQITNGCASGGDLGVNFAGNGDRYTGGQLDTWTYRAPAGTTLGPVTIDRGWGVTQNGADDGYASAAIVLYSGGLSYSGNNAENCQAYYGAAQCYMTDGAITIGGGGDNTFSFQAGCLGNADVKCTNSTLGRAGYFLHRARITLTDPTPPVGSSLSGSATSGTPLKGTQDVGFSATDVGSGVWAAQVTIDDTVVSPLQTFAGNLATCTANGNTAGFDAPVPCATSVTPSIRFDTTAVANGTHTLRVKIWDAAGNATQLATVPITTANPVVAPTAPLGPANGTSGDLASGKIVPKDKSSTVNGSVGHTVKLTGHLVDGSGRPIAGAIVDIREAVALPGAPTALTGTVKTNAQGGYAYVFKAKSSRTITLAYATHVGSTDYVSQAAVKLKAKAGITLRLSRSGVRVGGLVAFTGKVTVDPFPAGGSRVLVEAKTGNHWVLAGAEKTKKDGTFTYRHHFGRRGTFKFRARVLAASDLAARPASSASKTLRVR